MGPKMKSAIAFMRDGIVRSLSELNELGFDRKVVKRLKEAGALVTEQRGYYRISSDYETASDPKKIKNMDTFCYEYSHLLHQAGKDSVFCLYTAAYLQGLSDDVPNRIWIAYPSSKGSVRFPAHMSVKGVRWRQDGSFDEGIKTVEYGPRAVRLTSPERTLVDLLRFSHFVGNKTYRNSLMVDSDSVRVAFRNYANIPDFNPKELSRIASVFDMSELVEFYINISSAEKTYSEKDELIDLEPEEFDPDEDFTDNFNPNQTF